MRGPFSTFTDQWRVPIVTVGMRCTRSEAVLTLAQDRFSLDLPKPADSQLWSVPVCVRYKSGSETKAQCTLLTKKSATLDVQAADRPAWVEGNADASGYYRTSYSGDLLQKLTSADLQKQLDAPERVSLMYDVGAEARANLLSFGDALALAAQYRDDPVHESLLAVLRFVGSTRGSLIEPALEPDYQR